MKKIYILLAGMLMAAGMNAAVLTVADGTATNDRIPVRSDYADVVSHSQILYPSAYIQDLKDRNIKSMTFYVSSQASKDITASYTVGLAIVADNHFTADYYSNYAFNGATTTTVYEGTINAYNATVTLTFSTPYTYEGGNLLVDIKTKSTGAYADASFAGITTSQVQCLGHTTFGASGESFLPKTEFEYDGEAVTPCVKPKDLEISTVESTTANLSWKSGGEEPEWQFVCVEKGADWTWSGAEKVNVSSAHVENLKPAKDYVFYVRSYCDEDKQSLEYASIEFTTECGVITELPWEENFSSYASNVLPKCWSASGDGTAYVFSGGLMYGFTAAGSQVAVLPEFGIRLDTLAISFSYNTSDYNAILQLGYINSSSEFVVIGSSYASSKYYTDVNNVKLEGIPEETRQLAFRYNASEASYVYVDNLKIHVPEVETGIDKVQRDKVQCTMVIENGVLYLMYKGTKYNVQGKRIE